MKRSSIRRWDPRAASVLLVLLFLSRSLAAEPLASSAWGFRIDPPEGYAFSGGDGKTRFSFVLEQGPAPGSALLDLIVYEAERFPTVEALAADIAGKLRSSGDRENFDYRGKKAVLLRLELPGTGEALAGWGLCVELGAEDGARPPLLAMLAYGPARLEGLELYHLSALDSLAPSPAERFVPGPVTEFSYPPMGMRSVSLPSLGVSAQVDEGDAEAAKSVVGREFSVLKEYARSPSWKEAWTRFYRTIYRDSYERLSDVAFAVERAMAKRAAAAGPGSEAGGSAEADRRALAEGALEWVQGFAYERDLLGTDFVDLVSAAVEGRGDCDSRALLWALILRHGNIPSAIMVSRDYSHAMGLADLPGTGARFDLGGKKWLVAETTAAVPLGLIGAATADPAKWLGILLE